MTADRVAASFPRSERFELVSELGRGGMGVVYEVHDRDRQVRLALKAIRRVGAREILRLKSEFRAMRDLRHPNLVQLGDLFEHEGEWFFTMELIGGVDLLTWVRPGAPAGQPSEAPWSHGTTETIADGVAARTQVRDLHAPAEAARPGLDEPRLRAALRGLGAGVAALHRAGIVHRDLKPSNVMVDPDGRVVVLDFGVVARYGGPRSDDAAPRERVGTIAYMAPEQVGGDACGPAADWYAVGVVLFEALTGRLPFDGPERLHEKVTFAAPSPRSLAGDLPADLVELCERLLERDPARRPDDAEVLRWLGLGEPPSPDSEPGLFVGRDGELARLRAAFDEVVETGAARAVFIVGESGIGKTALARRFVDWLAPERPDLLVLASRCDERELVPYNALDGAVDALARWLAIARPEPPALPGAIHLVRTFPVLRAAVPPGPAPTDSALDPRALAFAALAELLGLAARKRPVLLLIDDVHWADVDSLALLAELFGGAGAPPVLLIATERTTGVPSPARGAVKVPTRTIALGGLEPGEVAALVRAVAPAGEVDAARLTAETGGHPMFLAELARRLGRPDAPQTRLDDALWQRIGELDAGARALVETIALTAAPLPVGAIAAASGLDAEPFARHLAALRDARLIRVTGTRDADTVEPYHDRVRETIAAHLAPARHREVHRAIVTTLEARDGAAEHLAYHLAHAGEPARAAAFAEASARRAIAALAFDRAAEWLRLVIELGAPAGEQRRRLLAERADMLARAGRTADSAAAFLAAADGADRDDGRELRRRAAEQQLIGGHLDQGLVTSRELLGELGLGLPRTRPGAIARLVWYQLRLRLSRLRWRERAAALAARTRLRVDLAWTIASGLSMVDSIRATVFALRGPLLALPAGDPARIARAACAAAVAAAGMGRGGLAVRLRDLAGRAAATSDDPTVARYSEFAELAIRFYMKNDWAGVIAAGQRAVALGDLPSRGHDFEADVIEQHQLWALNAMGDIAELRRRVPPAIRAAHRIGNRFVEIALRTFFPIVHLAIDRADDARADVRDALASWPADPGEVSNPFFFALKGRTQIALYDGAGLDDRALDDDWRRLRRSLFGRLPLIRVEASQWLGGLEAARARAARARGDQAACERHAAAAIRWTEQLRGSHLPVARPLVLQLRASIAWARGDRERAVPLLVDALGALERAGHLHAAASARWRLGEALAGATGAAYRRAAEDFFARHGVVRPARIVETLFPGGD